MNTKKRKITAVLVDRCNYGRIKPVLECIANHPDLELSIIATGTMLLERFGKPVDIVKKDGFRIDEEIYIEMEGNNSITMAKTLGLAILEFTSAINRLDPDIFLVIGDRFEALGATLAASYMNCCIAHIQGGEVSFTNDEVARHILTKTAHYHFPATIKAGNFLVMMGEDPECIFPFGCPISDVIHSTDKTLSNDFFVGKGLGNPIDPSKDYFLVIYHPVPTKDDDFSSQTLEMLRALQSFKTQTVWLWPNIDSGSDKISKTLRYYHEYEDSDWLYLAKNYTPEDFQKILGNAKCAIGNSSSFVRDASLWGTPVALIGDRQRGRETGKNVIECGKIKENDIKKAIGEALRLPHQKDDLYGGKDVSKNIAEKLSQVELYIQKQLHYIQPHSTVTVSEQYFNNFNRNS